MKPLSHVRVVDLTRLLPGGYCTLLMADLGADVLKVEEPGKGDYMRWMPPMIEGVSAGHLALNRGKRSMTLNLKHERGAEVLTRLVRDADVLVESFRPGVMERLGVGWDTLRAENPRLVYCAITGYGQDGPYRAKAGHDLNYIGYGGVLGITGERDGRPVEPGVQVGDLGGGALMAAVGVLAALAERERTGRGRFVDISMLDGVVSWLSIHASAFFLTGEEPRRGGMRLSGELACYRVYECADGRHVTLGALEPQFWIAFCEAIGRPELGARHLEPPEGQDEVAALVQEVMLTRTRDEWVADLAGLEACFGPVNDFSETFADPQVVARGMATTVRVPGGEAAAVGSPVRIVDAPGAPPEPGPFPPAPGFGEHTDEALRAAGYSEDEIGALRYSGAL